ncbi:MAG: hypothetical protein HY812_08650 [Planctomycetes bacterium]|nr:hypothetical protein [Planctomycetota bacterium]
MARSLSLAAWLLFAAAGFACAPARGVGQDGTSSGGPLAGSASCAACHLDHHRPWSAGGHQEVPCETCHGAGLEHSLATGEPRPPMQLPGQADLCLSCHGQGAFVSSPPQVGSLEEHLRHVSEKHVTRIDAGKVAGRCVFCHDPHSLE